MTPMTDSVQTAQMHVDPAVIDFAAGQPQRSRLPLDRIHTAATARLAVEAPSRSEVIG